MRYALFGEDRTRVDRPAKMSIRAFHLLGSRPAPGREREDGEVVDADVDRSLDGFAWTVRAPAPSGRYPEPGAASPASVAVEDDRHRLGDLGQGSVRAG